MQLAPAPWVPRSGAYRAVALEVLINGPISRSEIARKLDLSQGSLTRLSTPLWRPGCWWRRARTAPPGRGRGPWTWSAVSRHFVGVKLTGTDAMAVVTDLRANIVAFDRIALVSTEPARVVEQIAAIGRRARRRSAQRHRARRRPRWIGRGLHVVRRAPFLDWTDVPLGPMLAAATGLPTVIENDVVALTEAEHWFGSGRGLDRFAVLTVGAGVGYGAVINGATVLSPDSGIGLVGHWPLDESGPLCPQGHRGCAQAMLATPGIVGAIASVLGRSVGYDECLDLAAAGHPAARRVVDDAGRGLGRLIAAVANLTVPQLVILGGEGVRLADVAADAVGEGIRRDRDPLASDVEYTVNHTDEPQWCRGAAVIAIQTYVLGAHDAPGAA